ncbi:hypothetical protein AAG570_012098, partial [Ranatra chinensis]
ADVSTLVDRYFGHVYPDYGQVRETLVRQARDLLVCRYLGSLNDFETEFCVPASKEAQLLRQLSEVSLFFSFILYCFPIDKMVIDRSLVSIFSTTDWRRKNGKRKTTERHTCSVSSLYPLRPIWPGD